LRIAIDPRVAWVPITDAVGEPGAKIRLGLRGANSGSYPEIETNLIAAMLLMARRANANVEASSTASANGIPQTTARSSEPAAECLAGIDDLGLGEKARARLLAHNAQRIFKLK
jgi:hypothetical protein